MYKLSSKNRNLILIIWFFCLLLTSCGKVGKDLTSEDSSYISANGNDQIEIQSARKIVVFKNTASSSKKGRLIKKHKMKVIRDTKFANGMIARISADKISELQAEQDVLRVDDDIVFTALGIVPEGKGNNKIKTNTQLLPWGVDRIDSEFFFGDPNGKKVRVAVIDTGIDFNHPDLRKNIYGGFDTINYEKYGFLDDNGHGSHIAGTIGALNNRYGVVGICPDAVKIYSVKFLDENGTGYLSDLLEAYAWCLDNKIKVINMSFSSPYHNETLHEAVKIMHEAGVIQVAAAGNYRGPVHYPAKYPETIAVSAIDSSNNFAWFSCYGPEIDVTAPGVWIPSTYRNSLYAYMHGTSMAAPHVTGACAVKLVKNKNITPDEMKELLKNSAEYLPGLSSVQQGAGLIDVEKLMAEQ